MEGVKSLLHAKHSKEKGIEGLPCRFFLVSKCQRCSSITCCCPIWKLPLLVCSRAYLTKSFCDACSDALLPFSLSRAPKPQVGRAVMGSSTQARGVQGQRRVVRWGRMVLSLQGFAHALYSSISQTAVCCSSVNIAVQWKGFKCFMHCPLPPVVLAATTSCRQSVGVTMSTCYAPCYSSVIR